MRWRTAWNIQQVPGQTGCTVKPCLQQQKATYGGAHLKLLWSRRLWKDNCLSSGVQVLTTLQIQVTITTKPNQNKCDSWEEDHAGSRPWTTKKARRTLATMLWTLLRTGTLSLYDGGFYPQRHWCCSYIPTAVS